MGNNSRTGPRLAVTLIATLIVILLGIGIFVASFRPQAAITSARTTASLSVGSTSMRSSTGVNYSASTSSSGASQPSLTSITSSVSTSQSFFPLVSRAPCNHDYKVPVSNQTTWTNGTRVIESAEPAFVVDAGSTIDICVQFFALPPPAGNENSKPATVDSFTWPADFPGPQPPANNVTGSALPENVSLSAGQTTVVEYKISTGKNSTGFDGLWLGPIQSFGCAPVHLAIGFLPSQVNSSDFPNYQAGLPECFYPPLQAQIIGYSGASIAYLRSERIVTLSENVTNISVSSSPTPAGENITFKMQIRSFNGTLTVGQSREEGYVSTFNGNPELTQDSAGDYCHWQPNNQTSLAGSTYTPFSSMPNGSVNIDEPVIEITPYSSANYTFSVLIHGPIANYTTIDLVSVDVPVVRYFPVSIGGQPQTVLGSCPSILE